VIDRAKQVMQQIEQHSTIAVGLRQSHIQPENTPKGNHCKAAAIAEPPTEQLGFFDQGLF
jgi:hypothetical protein